jgi:hypothetical protein
MTIWQECLDTLTLDATRPALDWITHCSLELLQEQRWLREFAARPGSPVPPASEDELQRLYALSRVNQTLLLRFQPGNVEGVDYRGPDLTTEEYVTLMTALGFDVVYEAVFSPFFHEIVKVDQDPDDTRPITLVDTYWPALMLGDMLFSRAGVRVRGGGNVIRKDIAESSTLYWAWRRKNRRVADQSAGWGSHSQWKTAFRRDYRKDELFLFNVDGVRSLMEPLPDDEVALTRDARAEHLFHRCFITCDKTDDDLLSLDDTCALNAEGLRVEYDGPARMETARRRGEEAYDAMYDASTSSGASGCYSDAKYHFAVAIGIAERLGDAETVARLGARLQHIKDVFRSQFS